MQIFTAENHENLFLAALNLEFLLIYGRWSCLPVLKKGTIITTDYWVPWKISTTDNTHTSGCNNSINYDLSVQLKLEGWLFLCFIPVHNFIGYL